MLDTSTICTTVPISTPARAASGIPGYPVGGDENDEQERK